MTTFPELNLKSEILNALTDLGFEKATPVQEKVIPHLSSNNGDLVALAQTGTGKTAAFALPILNVTEPDTKHPQALILSPTRELCLQICRDIDSFAKYLKGIRPVAVYGGTPIQGQIKDLKRGRQIVVATPGRLNDLIRRRAIDLSQIEKVVLDEADEMLDMGFLEDLENILSEVPDEAQTLLFSATMPRSVETIANRYMTDAEKITIGQRNSGSDTVSHQYYMVHAKDRYKALKRIADAYPGMYAIVFCRTRAEANNVSDKLMSDGYNADALHGDLSQAQRDYVMEKFRRKSLQMLVATDVAARGLDVNNLTHVINYNLPDDAECYNHRSGRTGRAGRSGISAAIIHMREKHKINQIERAIKRKFEYVELPTGQTVCEAQLMHIMDKVKSVEVNEEQIAKYIPAVMEKIGDMSKEELIKHFVSLEFNMFLEYYKNAPNLNAKDNKGEKKERRKDIKTLAINIGRKNKIAPRDLIGFINKTTPGHALYVGQILIEDNQTLFEVAEGDVNTFLVAFENANFDEAPVTLELTDRVIESRNNRGSRGGDRGGRGRDRDRGGRGRDRDRGGRGRDGDRRDRGGRGRDGERRDRGSRREERAGDRGDRRERGDRERGSRRERRGGMSGEERRRNRDRSARGSHRRSRND